MLDKKFSASELLEIEALEVRGGNNNAIPTQNECVNNADGCGSGTSQDGCTNNAECMCIVDIEPIYGKCEPILHGLCG